MKFLAASIVLAAIAGIAASTSPQIRNTLSQSVKAVLPTDEQDGENHATQANHDETVHETHSKHNADSHESHESHGGHHARHKIVTTSPAVQDVTLTQPFVCQIHSRRHIDIKAIEGGYLDSIEVNEGQWVHKGDVMFHILPTLYKARVDAGMAEAKLAQVEYDNTKNLVDQNIVSPQELKLARAKLDKSLAQVALAQAERNFADIKAPFDGIVDRLHEQEGSLIEEGSLLTTMSDNSVMWVYFNVPEKYYLAFQRATQNGRRPEDLAIQLRLANQEIFEHTGVIGAIEADFDNETGNISFRADFPNPSGLLRHGQTGTVLIQQGSSRNLVATIGQ